MSRRRKKEDEVEEMVLVAEEPEAPAAAPKVVLKPEPVFTFDRYFASLGHPAHWKAGMRAYLSGRAAKGKKTVAEWNRLFLDY